MAGEATAASTATTSPLRLHIVGWRSVAHSIALVNQWQMLSLLKRSDVRLTMTDAPFAYSSWTPGRGILTDAQADLIESVPELASEDDFDLEFQIPFDAARLDAKRNKKKLGFIVTEYRGAAVRNIMPSLQAINARDDVEFVTPSNWSKLAFQEEGLLRPNITVVPHAVDSAFHPSPDLRERLRGQLRLDKFVFLHVGAMSLNKGIVDLLEAFAALVGRGLPARLILKGNDSVYPARDWLKRCLSGLDRSRRDAIVSNMTYIGQSLDTAGMCALYNAADAYVSPYRAEGFNLPVLEAAACGLPVICTRGGPTDDFTTRDFAVRIRSVPGEMDGSYYLQPDVEHLIESMSAVVHDSAFRRRAAAAGPIQAAKYTWDGVVDQLVQVAKKAAAA